MSVYTSCAYECAHKALARKLVEDINDAGILCFYAGDIPEDTKYDMMDVIAAANDKSDIFMPFLCREYEGSRLAHSELAVATSHVKFVIPILLDPDYGGVKPGGLLTGIKITDISSSAKYESELPDLLRTIRAMISAANVRSDRATGSVRSEEEDRETGSEEGDEDGSDGWSAAGDQDDSEAEMAEGNEDA